MSFMHLPKIYQSPLNTAIKPAGTVRLPEDWEPVYAGTIHLAVSRMYNGKAVLRGCQSVVSQLSLSLVPTHTCRSRVDVI